MHGFNPKITELFDSLSNEEREDLRWMLDCGLTKEAAQQLLVEGLAEEKSTGCHAVEGFPVLFTKSAKDDLMCFATAEVRKRLKQILSSLRAPTPDAKLVALPNGAAKLLCDGPFRVVFCQGEADAKDVVFAIAPAGISPTTTVWRYFDQSKAENLLQTGCLYFCRLDKLTGDPIEARLSFPARQLRIQAFQEHFGEHASRVVDEGEEILRGTTYVCCWTRREHESYLAWKHFCSAEGGRPGGGFAIRTAWRRIIHLHSALRAKDDQIHCRAVGYLDPLLEDLPNHAEGEQAFWKSKWFSDENEIRLAALRPLSGSHEEILKHINEKLPFGEWIPCDLSLLVDEIIINPFASTEQQRKLKEILERFRPELSGRVRESPILIAERQLVKRTTEA